MESADLFWKTDWKKKKKLVYESDIAADKKIFCYDIILACFRFMVSEDYGYSAQVIWAILWFFNHFHYMEKSDLGILQKISFCIPENKESHRGVDQQTLTLLL